MSLPGGKPDFSDATVVRPQPAPPRNIIKISGVTPITQAMLDSNTQLKVRIYNSAPGITLLVAGEYYDINRGDSVPFQETIVPTFDRLVNTKFINLSTGYLTLCRVSVSAGTTVRGQTWVVVETQKDILAQTILAAYVTNGSSPSFPLTPIQTPTEGRGRIRSIQYSPGSANDVNITVPANTLWNLLNISGLFTTSALAGNRRFYFTASVDGSASQMVTSDPSATIAPSNGMFYSIGPYGATSTAFFTVNATNFQNINMFNAYLITGGGVISVTENIAVGDTYLGNLTVEEWLNI